MSKEFVRCPKPKCKSPNIGGDFQSEYGGAWRLVTCEDCGFSWVEHFELISNWDENDEFEIDENGEAI